MFSTGKNFTQDADVHVTHSALSVGVAGGDASLDENSHHLAAGITIRLPPY
jgi:hypothetical protein